MTTFIDEISQAGANQETNAEQALQRPFEIKAVVSGLEAKPARIKFGCAKVLRLISERKPELLYPYFEVFVDLLDSPNKILQWEAIYILSYLVRVDSANRFPDLFDKYFAPIPGPTMITAANVIGGAARIARAKPEWADRIAVEILKVSRAHYQTRECRNVALGHAIQAFEQFYPSIKDSLPVLRFVKRQLKNSRPSTTKKAQAFLKRYGR